MIDPRIIREHIDVLEKALAQRQAAFDTGSLKEIDEKRRSLIVETEKLKNEKNVLSNEIAKLKKSGADAADKIEYQRSLGQRIEACGRDLKVAEEEWEQLALIIPNILYHLSRYNLFTPLTA